MANSEKGKETIVSTVETNPKAEPDPQKEKLLPKLECLSSIDVLQKVFWYLLLAFLLSILSSCFSLCSAPTFTEGTSFITSLICYLISLVLVMCVGYPTVKVYDKLVVQYTKFTKVFSIYIIINTLTNMKSPLLDLAQKLLAQFY